jgi:ATP-dependent DNA ligase
MLGLRPNHAGAARGEAEAGLRKTPLSFCFSEALAHRLLDPVVVSTGRRVAVFDKLHSRAHDHEAFLYAFDLLELDDEDWRPQPLEVRKLMLERLLAKGPIGIQFVEHLDGDGAGIFAHACKLGCEGIVSKHREHPYRSGPSKA